MKSPPQLIISGVRFKLKTFGIASDLMGGREHDFDLRGNTVGDLKRALVDRYPSFGQLRSFMIAVNMVYGSDEAVINENDEVVIIPPVSGG